MWGLESSQLVKDLAVDKHLSGNWIRSRRADVRKELDVNIE